MKKLCFTVTLVLFCVMFSSCANDLQHGKDNMDYNVIINNICESVETVDFRQSQDVIPSIEKATGAKYIESSGSGIIVDAYKYDENLKFFVNSVDKNSITIEFYMIDNPDKPCKVYSFPVEARDGSLSR